MTEESLTSPAYAKRVNEFLREEERKIQAKQLHPTLAGSFANVTVAGSNTSKTSNGTFYFTSTQPNVVRAGSGRRRVNPDGTPYVKPEFPEGGDPAFRAVLAEMLTIHISKSSDYGTGANPYANYSAAEAIGVPAWKSCFVRALEKVQRLTNAFGGKKLNHENVTDSLLDLANQIVITKVLWDYEQAKTACCGGNCASE